MKKAFNCLGLFLSLSVFEVSADVVNQVRFEGLDRVELSVVEDHVTIKPGKEYTEEDVDETIKALFSTGFFVDVKLKKVGSVLVICCKEKWMVDKVAFEGNNAAKDDNLRQVIGNRLSSGRLFSSYIIKDIVADFQMMYKAMGYCSAVIVPKIIKRPGNKVDVVFEINEGSKTTVKKVFFIGNHHFSDDDLKDVMSTKEEKIWRFWDYDSHIYREDRINVDVDAITAFYKNHGYPFFMITGTSAEISPDKTSYFCTFTLEEGDRYNISKVILESNVKAVKAKDFKKFIAIKDGEIYDDSKIIANRDSIRREISLQDHPFVDVTIDVDYNKQSKTATVKYTIVERSKAFLERIDIVGNSRTLDHVIRREFTIHEGDALNPYKIDNAVKRLKGVGYFDDVEITELDGSAEDKKVLLVNVKEKESTAQFKFGLNVNDSDGFGGMVGFTEINFMGTGRTLGLEAMWMQRYFGVTADLYDPRFMDQNFGAGIRLGYTSHNRKSSDSSTYKALFISPYVRYGITENLYHTIRYHLANNKKLWWDKPNNKWRNTVPEDKKKNVTLPEEYGKYTSGEISSTLVYYSTDDEFNPRSGYELSMTNSYCGVVGNVRYFKNEFGVKLYYPLGKKSIFTIEGNLGHIHEIKQTRSINRFSLGGGESMRGFNSDGVGPREKERDKDSIGGNKYWTITCAAKTPLSTKEIGINGVVFLDFGSAWGVRKKIREQYKDKINDSNSVRISAGVAIEWVKSPLGMPMSFIFGFPLKKKSFDEKQVFTLSGFM